MFSNTFHCSPLPSGNRECTATVTHVLIDTTFVRVAIVASTTQSSVHTYASNPKPINITERSRSTQSSPRQRNSKAPVVAQHSTFSLHMRDVGDLDANHVLIRVRHRSRTSTWVPFNQCAAHGNAEFFQTILGLVLRFVGLILISVLLCLTLSFDFFLVQPLLD